MSTTTKSYEAMRENLRAIIHGGGTVKSAMDTAPSVPEQDPAKKDAPAVKVDPEAANSKQHLPPNKTNGPTSTEPVLEFIGSAPKSKVDGNAKDDAFTSPTAPLDKIAGIMAKIRELKTGSAPAHTPVKTAASTSDPANNLPLNEAEFLQKLAHHYEQYHNLFGALQASDEGMELLEQVLRKQAGAEAAASMVKEAGEAAQFLQQQWEIEQAMMKQAAAEQELVNYEAASELNAFQEIWKEASEADRGDIVKLAEMHQHNIGQFDENLLKQAARFEQAAVGLEKAAAAGTDRSAYEYTIADIDQEAQLCLLEKQAYMGGAADGAAMMDQPEMQAPDEGAPPSAEELVALIDELVQSGQITEEQAAQIAAMIAGEEGGEAEPSDAVKQASMLCVELVG